MKILILTGNYPQKNALNNGIFIHQQVKALQQLGVECHVLLLHNWYPSFGLHKYHTYWRQGFDVHGGYFEEFEGVKIHSVPMFIRMPNRFFKENYYDRAARSVIKYVKNNSALHNADWLYAHFLTDIGYIAAKVKDVLKVKLAAIARGDDVHAWPEQNPALIENLTFVFQKADLLLANSRNLANDTKKWMLPGKIRKVETVYNGIDSKEYRPATSEEEKQAIKAKYKLLPDKKYLLCVATPVALKGWMELFHALKLTREKFDGWILLMIAPLRNYTDAINLLKTGNELAIAEHLMYIGGLPPSDLAEVFRGCDAFVLPSYNEGMANALLEAMASGLACIATDVGGHNEIIENKDEGLLVKPRTVEELAIAIQTVISDEPLRKTMGLNARKKMISMGDYIFNSRKLLDLFTHFPSNHL